MSSAVVATRNQVSCNVGAEAVILGLASGMYYGLDPVGARIWALLQAPTRVAQIRDALVTEYDVEPAQCEHDLIAILEALATAGLIELSDGSPL